MNQKYELIAFELEVEHYSYPFQKQSSDFQILPKSLLICPQVIIDHDLRETVTDFTATLGIGNIKHNKEKPPSNRRQISSRNMHWSWDLFGTYLGLIDMKNHDILHKIRTSRKPENHVK